MILSRWWQSRTRRQRVCWSLTWKGRATASGWRNRQSVTISPCEGHLQMPRATAMACLVFYMLKLHAKILFGLLVCCSVQLCCFSLAKKMRHLQTTDLHMVMDWGNWIWSFFTQAQRYKIHKTSSRQTIVWKW